MPNVIRIKRSAVASKVPVAGDLQLGELAINTFEGKLYTKKDNGTASIVEIGGPSSSLGTAAAPVWTFLSDLDTGIYSPGANQLAITTSGTQKFTIDSLDGNPIIDNQFPTIAPTLDLAFALTKQLDPRITFSRASSGTYFDSNGVLRSAASDVARFDHNPATGESLGLLVEEARTNSATYSQYLYLSAWPAINLPQTPNAGVAPDQSITATALTVNTVSGGHYITRSISASGANTYSLYAKANGYNTVALALNNNSALAAWFNLSTLQSSLVGVSVTSNSIVDVGSGWRRISISVSATITSAEIYVAPSAGFSPVSGDGVSGVLAWGAQLEAGSFPTSYIPTPATFTGRTSTATFYNASGVVQTAASGVARSDAFFPDSNGVMRSAGLLLEAVGTNLLTYSEQLNDASWTKSNATVTANAIAAPDGTTTAELIYPTTTGSLRYVYKSASITSDITTMSFFAKSAGMTRCYLVGGTTSIAGWFDLSAGTVGTVTSGCTASIEKLSNGWYRCSLSQPISATPYASIGPCDADNSFVATTSATNGIYVWGGQLETGSYDTSYIPTVASTVTRSADTSTSATVTRAADLTSITGTNFSSWYNQAEGTIVTKRSSTQTATGSYTPEWQLSGSPYGPQVLEGIFYASGSSTFTISGYSLSAGSTAVALKSNNFAACYNGGTVSTNNSATLLDSRTLLRIGSQAGGSTTYMTTRFARITYYPVRLPNTQLQALTAT